MMRNKDRRTSYLCCFPATVAVVVILVSVSTMCVQQQRLQQLKRQNPRRDRRRRPVRPPTFLDFNSSFDLQFSIGNTTVSVGKQASAVQHAKTHGLAQRMRGSARNQWNALETSTCLQQGSQPHMLSLPEIQRLQLPQAILIGVQKGGTTALYNYLDQHPDIAECTKELYFLDEHVDKMVVKRNGSSIPQLQARQA
jgi:hypothetical protein